MIWAVILIATSIIGLGVAAHLILCWHDREVREVTDRILHPGQYQQWVIYRTDRGTIVRLEWKD